MKNKSSTYLVRQKFQRKNFRKSRRKNSCFRVAGSGLRAQGEGGREEGSSRIRRGEFEDSAGVGSRIPRGGVFTRFSRGFSGNFLENVRGDFPEVFGGRSG